MKKIINLFILVLMLVSCKEDVEENSLVNYESFINIVKENNLEFKELEPFSDNLLGAKKNFPVEINNELVNIYLFDSNDKMEKASKTVDSTGSTITNGESSTKVDWILPPRFYKKDLIIIVYCGENEEIINIFKDNFGETFAGVK